MRSFDRTIRRFIPSTAVLSRSHAFALVSRTADLLSRPVLRLLSDKPVPPTRLIVRTGVGNSILFPHYYYLTASQNIWLFMFGKGYANLESRIVDIGSGVGKSAVALRDFVYGGQRFEGLYTGFDVDPEMVRWSQENFPSDHFRFSLVEMYSKVYNPGGVAGRRPGLDCEDSSTDLVFSQSLFSHLLEEDIEHYLRESYRILRPGGAMLMTFFCLDDLEALGLLGGRWTFSHAMGAARVENRDFPESAVAYNKEWMLELARRVGFSSAGVILPNYQSTLECVK